MQDAPVLSTPDVQSDNVFVPPVTSTLTQPTPAAPMPQQSVPAPQAVAAPAAEQQRVQSQELSGKCFGAAHGEQYLC